MEPIRVLIADDHPSIAMECAAFWTRSQAPRWWRRQAAGRKP